MPIRMRSMGRPLSEAERHLERDAVTLAGAGQMMDVLRLDAHVLVHVEGRAGHHRLELRDVHAGESAVDFAQREVRPAVVGKRRAVEAEVGVELAVLEVRATPRSGRRG